MQYPITLVWSFRNRFDVLKKSISTAHKILPLYVNFCLIDASSDEETIRTLRTFCNSLKDRKIRICESAYRTTVSQAWNLGIMLADTRYVVFASSDVEFKNDTWFSDLKKMIDARYQYVLVENHALFMIDKKVITKIGWFDERYILGPHFDTDYMIRASEGKARFIIIPNNASYIHSDTPEETSARKKGEVKDRLPMHDITNETIFKKKWKSSWPGWKDGEHPPTHISQVMRMLDEIDPHPLYTKQYLTLYMREPAGKTLSAGIKRLSVKIRARLSP